MCECSNGGGIHFDNVASRLTYTCMHQHDDNDYDEQSILDGFRYFIFFL